MICGGGRWRRRLMGGGHHGGAGMSMQDPSVRMTRAARSLVQSALDRRPRVVASAGRRCSFRALLILPFRPSPQSATPAAADFATLYTSSLPVEARRKGGMHGRCLRLVCQCNNTMAAAARLEPAREPSHSWSVTRVPVASPTGQLEHHHLPAAFKPIQQRRVWRRSRGKLKNGASRRVMAA